MWRLTLKNLRAHKRRLAATCFAVLLGVSFLSATLATGDTMRAGFGELITELNDGTAGVVRSTTDIGNDEIASERGLVDQSLVPQIAAVDGVRAAHASIDVAGQIIDTDGDPVGGNGPPTRAGNFVDDPALAGYGIVEGRAPAGPDEIVMDKGSADKAGYEVGDVAIVRVPDVIEATVVGIVTYGQDGEYDSISGSTWVGFTTERAATLLLGQPGRTTEIVIAAEPGVTQTELVERVTPLLPDGLEAVTGQQIEDEFKSDLESDFIGFFETFLLVFAGIALLVATFSIYNTFAIIVAQRTRESALLRALGASRRQVLRSITLEALAVGVVASALGIAAGVGLAHGIAALLESMDLELPVGIVVSARTIVISSLVGVGITLLASVAPAVRASRVAPLAALREVSIDRSANSVLRGALGAVTAVAGIAMVLSTASGGSLAVAGLGAVLALVGMVLLGPVVARPVSATLGVPVAAIRGSSGRLARRNAMRNPRRTAASASALMVGVAVVALFTVFAASIKQSIQTLADDSVSAQIVVETDSFSGVGLNPEMAEEMAGLPEMDAVVGAGEGVVTIEGSTEYPMILDVASMPAVADMEVTQGSMELTSEYGLAVADDYAEDKGWTLGAEVPVTFADGDTRTFTVDAIYGLDNLFGEVMMNRSAYAPHATQLTDVVVLATVADGTSLTDAKAAVQQVVDRYYGPEVLDRDEYIDSVNAEIDQALALVYGLLAVAVIIAVMGIANTVSLAVHERTRELGLLRAVGQTRRQTRTMVRWESVMIAVFGTLGGIVLGSFLGWGMVRAIGEQEGIGEFALPVSSLAVVLLLGAAAGTIAALRPARRAARLDVLQAIAT
jgi:putative ABC transport system permease protein